MRMSWFSWPQSKKFKAWCPCSNPTNTKTKENLMCCLCMQTCHQKINKKYLNLHLIEKSFWPQMSLKAPLPFLTFNTWSIAVMSSAKFLTKPQEPKKWSSSHAEKAVAHKEPEDQEESQMDTATESSLRKHTSRWRLACLQKYSESTCPISYLNSKVSALLTFKHFSSLNPHLNAVWLNPSKIFTLMNLFKKISPWQKRVNGSLSFRWILKMPVCLWIRLIRSLVALNKS